MIRLARWKVVLVALAVVLGFLFALPNLLSPAARAKLPGFVPHQGLNLGLDLQGGSYLLLEVDTAALRREHAANLTEDVRKTLHDGNIGFTGLAAQGDDVVVRIANPGQIDAAQTLLAKLAEPLAANTTAVSFNVQRQADQSLRLHANSQAFQAESAKAVQQSIEIVRRRVDALGTREPTIIRQGADRIVVQAPGESDPERLKAVIGKTAKLSFQMVDDAVSPSDAAAGVIPPDDTVLPSDDGREASVVVKSRALVTGDMLTTASQQFDQFNRATVAFQFNGEGARKFADATTTGVGKRFAIVLDGRVLSAPVIETPIVGGSGQITGSFTPQSANDLAVLLRAGALPAPLIVQEQRSVGAELGADAIRAGAVSTAVGFAAIVVFIILAYGFLFGGVSVIGLLVNGLLIIAAMSMTQATLTLPGIAGLILSLALAVDANVLIYERIRDEERTGHSPIAAMDVGYRRALVSIVDANVTTMIAALIMFAFGAGVVRGFAWTLAIGVVTSVFSAVLVSQVLLGWWLRVRRPKRLPI